MVLGHLPISVPFGLSTKCMHTVAVCYVIVCAVTRVPKGEVTNRQVLYIEQPSIAMVTRVNHAAQRHVVSEYY